MNGTDRITALNNGQICTLPYPAWYNIVMKDSVADQSGLWAYAPMPAFEGTSGNVSLGRFRGGNFRLDKISEDRESICGILSDECKSGGHPLRAEPV